MLYVKAYQQVALKLWPFVCRTAARKGRPPDRSVAPPPINPRPAPELDKHRWEKAGRSLAGKVSGNLGAGAGRPVPRHGERQASLAPEESLRTAAVPSTT